ncbi:hypothetical protein SANTM175S_01636 [Streptomyces antimycoticus]
MMKSNCGKASSMSITRLISESTQPPKYPAMMPKMVPRTTATTAARKATSSEIRAP